MKKLPKKLFVKIMEDQDAEYFVADTRPELMAEVGEKVRVGVYQMVESIEVAGVVTTRKIA